MYKGYTQDQSSREKKRLLFQITQTRKNYRLNCVPQNSYVGVLTPVPQNVTLFGNRAVADIINIRSYWSIVGPSFNMTGILIKRVNLDTDTHIVSIERIPCEYEGRDQGDASTNQGTTRSQGRGLEESFSLSSERTSPAKTLISDFKPPKLGQ